MAFDQTTRSRLQKFVSSARAILSEEFTRQLQATYGLDPKQGTVAEVSSLTHLDNRQRQTAHLLRETLAHYLATTPGKGESDRTKQALDRIVREQAFTVLNRLGALRMAEARGFLLESIGKAHSSKGFQLYRQLAGASHGETGDAYRNYLFSLFDEFSLDLAVLFDRHSAQGRLFPRESSLLELLDEINHVEIEHLWAEDETIGWIYQYFNSQEERKKMRAESQAPRNSRELAVRNQFFTPRYVVEFLTDNTLGRIWYEMTQGNTGIIDSCRYLVRRPSEIFLKPGEQAPEESAQEANQEYSQEGTQEDRNKALSQEELLKQPVYIPHRALKDPRSIRMLDPACGSMHFGLYAFDLFERIYLEAWQLEAELGPDAFEREDSQQALQTSFENLENFKAQVPKLIIEHNIHGVDIDPRAAQIAGLSLWQRAQRTWHQQGIKPQQRPRIVKSNIVCAEPMPGEKALLQEFTSKLNPPVLGQLLEVIFDKMQLAGEAGTLLKIEEEIQTAIKEAREQWLKQSGSNSTGDMFQTELDAATPQTKLGFDLSGVDDETFWDDAEQHILQALSDYADQAGSNADQKRLFADDAARGFAFIDLCRKRFDVVLMNPPFGKASVSSGKYLDRVYPASKLDIYASFVERGVQVAPKGFTGAITSRTGFFLSSLSEWRKKLMSKANFELILDLGNDVLDAAMVSTASYVIRNTPVQMACNVIPMLDLPITKRESLIDNIDSITEEGKRLFSVDFSKFKNISGSPFCYWMQPKAVDHLSANSVFKSAGRDVRVGLQTGDNFRFLRAYWEVPQHQVGHEWVPYAKGGDYSPYYRDIELVIEWKDNGSIVKQLAKDLYGSESRTIKSQDKYFNKGLTFTIYTVKGFNIRPLPEGCIFDVAGSSVFLDNSNEEDFFYILGFMSSPVFQYFISAISDDRKWQVGLLQSVPWVEPTLDARDSVARNSKAACNLAQSLRRFDETDRAFEGFDHDQINLRKLNSEFEAEVCNINREISSLWLENAKLISNLYGLDKNRLNRKPTLNFPLLEDQVFDTGFEWNDDKYLAKAYISWIVGVLFGRWTETTNEKLAQSSAFDAPELSNVMSSTSLNRAVFESEILIEKVLGSVIENSGNHENLTYIEQCIGLELAKYLSNPKGFFDDHMRVYTKSRRQAPVYWPLQTPSGSYTLWVYYHSLNEQTLYTCVNNFVEPKLEQIEQDLSALRSKSARSSQEEKELAKLTDLGSELKDFRDELLRIAKFWKPNLNDGVQVTAAPLWKLFQHKAWQKKLKDTWNKLEKGDYDWAHLACSIWPERVLLKCHQDRSLAIAHDVENIFWHEVEVPVKRGKKLTGETKLEWQPKDLSDAELDALVKQTIAEMN